MKQFFFILIFLLWGVSLIAQNNPDGSIDYSFIVQDSPSALFTMRQSNQNYLSFYRLFSRSLDHNIQNQRLADLIKVIGIGLFFQPLTHEEGHRSILTVHNIGSVSKPFFNSKGFASVTGLTDQTLIELRNGDLPTYIRLHTAGLESDYMLTIRAETQIAFDLEGFDTVKWEYWMRKMGIMQYFLLGLFKYEVGLKEDNNELKRDIVGYDTYGAARHLFRPDMDFYRYTNYSDLEKEERRFVERMGFRSLLNMATPLMFGKQNFQVSPHMQLQVGLGYSLAPFGDFIDENIWLKTNRHYLHIYLRQFQNHKTWYPALGFTIYDIGICRHLSGTFASHFWSQPVDFDFFTNSAFQGGALDALLRYRIFSMDKTGLKAVSIDLGLLYKTKGFLPEEVYLKEHFGIRLGTSFWID